MKHTITILFFTLLLFSCSAVDNAPQKKFGADSYYFLGLRAADQNKEKESIRQFKIAREKGSELAARRSAQSLTLLGSIKDRNKAAVYLAEHYPDSEAQLTACRELFKNGEFVQVITLTDGIDLEKDANELIELRMLSFIEKEDSRLHEDLYRWFVSRPLSLSHLTVYQSYKELDHLQLERIQQYTKDFQNDLNRLRIMEQSLAPQEMISQEETEAAENFAQEPMDDFLTEDEEIEEPCHTIIDYRVSIYRKKYLQCYENRNKIFKIYENYGNEIDCQLLSDIGKAALYGTNDYAASARSFDRLAQTLSSNQAYYACFYAARLYDKAGRYQAQAADRFRKALTHAADEIQYDNCLWYLLNFQLRTSTDDIIETLKKYGANINSPAYFDDFFESLAVLLLSNHKWQDFYKVWMETDSNFSESIDGKYAYISGRLIEEGLAEGNKELKTRQTVDAFTRVLTGGGDLYYKVCALERLNLTDDEMVRSVLLVKGQEDKTREQQTLAGKLIDGYAAFGFPQKVYTEFLTYRKELSVSDSISAAGFLNKCAMLDEKNTNDYNVQSLRIASRCYADSYGKLPYELLELTYPRFYRAKIEKACTENSLPEYLLYALVRSESFFDSQIQSRAGANGLTQLMEATAQDEARKLKIENPDILDPETNLRMGAHYLSSLIERTDGKNKLLALFAYNAGLSHVRSWVSAARKDWESTEKSVRGPAGLPTDLFLETLPFTETREYGRKIISSAAAYGWLYENKTPAETVREIIN